MHSYLAYVMIVHEARSCHSNLQTIVGTDRSAWEITMSNMSREIRRLREFVHAHSWCFDVMMSRLRLASRLLQAQIHTYSSILRLDFYTCWTSHHLTVNVAEHNTTSHSSKINFPLLSLHWTFVQAKILFSQLSNLSLHHQTCISVSIYLLSLYVLFVAQNFSMRKSSPFTMHPT